MRKYQNESLGRWISLLHRYFQVYMRDQLKEYDVYADHHLFLGVLYQQEGLSQDELARHVMVDKGTTARALRKLEESGYIERKTFSVNKKVKKVYLTEKAHCFEAKRKNMLRGWTRTLAKGMTDQEFETAIDLFHKMTRNARDYTQDINDS